jgi:ABC-type nitrate/sulfonate/bicarbonate transport system substrate-binding protein
MSRQLRPCIPEASSAGVVRRRRVLSVGLVSAAAIGLPSIAAHAQGSLRTLKMVSQNPFQLTDYPALIADRTGGFAKRGIKAEFTTATNSVLPLLSGDVDITTVGSANGLLPMARKQDFQLLCVNIQRLVLAVLVKPDSPLVKLTNKWPDVFHALRGKKLGVTVAGGLVEQIGLFLASVAGMTPGKDIVVHPAGDANVLLANLETGVYDAALQLSPQFEIAQRRKMAVSVLDVYKGEGPRELALFPFATPGTRKSFIEKNTDLINNYIAALQEANDFARKPENHSAVLDMVAQAVKVDKEALKEPINTFVAAVGNTVKMTREQWASTLQVGKVNNVIKEDIPFEDAVYVGGRA